MALCPIGKWRNIAAAAAIAPLPLLQSRSFRSDAALEALAKASQEKVPNFLLYNYPSFSSAFSALFAHLFHSGLNLPCLSLPFSSVEPFRSMICALKDWRDAIFLIFLARKDLQSSLQGELRAKIPSAEDCPKNLTFGVNTEKSSL